MVSATILNGGSVTIKGLAYETTAGKRITTGQMFEK